MLQNVQNILEAIQFFPHWEGKTPGDHPSNQGGHQHKDHHQYHSVK